MGFGEGTLRAVAFAVLWRPFSVCLELIGLIASAVFRVCGVVRYTQTYKMI